MAGLNLGLGAADWLKMRSPSQTVPPIGSGPTAPMPAPGGGASAPKPVPYTPPNAPKPSAGAAFNWSLGNSTPATPPPSPLAPPAAQNATPPPTVKFGYTPPVGGTPAATSTQPQIVNKAAPAMGMTYEAAPASPTIQSVPAPVPQMEETPQANPAATPPGPITPPSPPATIADKAREGGPGPGPEDKAREGVQGPPPGTEPVQPTTPEPKGEQPPSELDQNMANYEKIASDWANGIVDEKVFRTTANRAILQMGLNNQAERDALQMRINGDPSLAGQGAGAALLSIMSAKQGFNADQMFGMLAQDAQQKILDLQKFGLQQGVAINAQRRQNEYNKIASLEAAGNFSAANDIRARLTGMARSTFVDTASNAARSRIAEDISVLLQTGDTNAAADKIALMTGTRPDPAELAKRDPTLWTRASDLESKGDFEGAAKAWAAVGVNVTADDLRAQSPIMQGQWLNELEKIKAIAAMDPAGAEARLQSLLKNPAAAKYLGMTGEDAHDLVQSLVTGDFQSNQNLISTLGTAINDQAKYQAPFAQALSNYEAMPAMAKQGMENAAKDMAKQDLVQFNKLRTEAGLDAVHLDAKGNILDSHNVALDEKDFFEMGARADYARRATKTATQPWQTAYDALVAPGSAFASKILSVPGGDQTVKEALQTLYLGGAFKYDEATDSMVPDYSSGMPWDNPKTEHLFHNWPMAHFYEDGSFDKYDMGGEEYGLKVGNSTIQKTQDDMDLDDKYATYKYNKGDLSASEWYFATAGGTRPVTLERLPPELKDKPKDLTNVGLDNNGNPTPPAPPTPTPKPIAVEVASIVPTAAGMAEWMGNQETNGNKDHLVSVDSTGTTAKVTGLNGSYIKMEKDGLIVYYDPKAANYVVYSKAKIIGVGKEPRVQTFAEALENAKKVKG